MSRAKGDRIKRACIICGRIENQMRNKRKLCHYCRTKIITKNRKTRQTNTRRMMVYQRDDDYELLFCRKCQQMTNHLNGKCMKHKENDETKNN